MISRALGAQLSDAIEDGLLMGGVALYHRNEVGDQVIAAFELGIDVAPGLGNVIAKGDKTVELENDISGNAERQYDRDEKGDFHESGFVFEQILGQEVAEGEQAAEFPLDRIRPQGV